MAAQDQYQAIQEVGHYLQTHAGASSHFQQRAQQGAFLPRLDLHIGVWRTTASNNMTCVRLTIPSGLLSNR